MKKIVYKILKKINQKFKIKKKYYYIKKKITNKNRPSIDIVIPTFKKNPYLDKTIQSILNQKYPQNKIRIIISFNGDDFEYLRYLKKTYNSNNILIINTTVKNVSAARNNAIFYLKNDLVTFVDDDDLLTKNFLKKYTKYFKKDVSIVCTKLVDYNDETNTYEYNTYINKSYYKNSRRISSNLANFASSFATLHNKIYKKELFQKYFEKANEKINNSEDVLFWIDNFDKIKGSIYIPRKGIRAYYVRRLTINSLSRPNGNNEFDFYINQRLNIIKMLEERVLQGSKNKEYIKFVINQINSQTIIMLNYFNKLDNKQKNIVRKKIYNSNLMFLNKSLFSEVSGIAFCHDFPPYVTPSAYVATKRLDELTEILKKQINWTVVSGNIKKKDFLFESIYAKNKYTIKLTTEQTSVFSEKSQYEWGLEAFELVKDKEVKYIYSRTNWPGSHVAAFLYKKKYPNVIWYAEFSDPISTTSENQKRKSTKKYEGNESFLNNFWEKVENDTYEYADFVIFTNDNQKEFMIKKCKDDILSKNLEKKSMVLNQPILPHEYCNIIKSNYSFDDRKINIAYFGSFYKHRKSDEMLKLVKNKNIILHIFTSKIDVIIEDENVKVNREVSFFEFLNIATRCDYLFLNDMDYLGKINPYLPSKLADYLSTKTKIIAKVNENTALSKYENENIIKIKEINDDFLKTLKKSINQ